MKRRANRLIWTGMLLASMVLSAPLYAQMAGGGGHKGAGPGGQQMSGMMHTMATEMMQMSRQMSKGDMDAATQQRMQEHMRDMAGMMEKMSGMMGKGMMMDADTQKQMEQMHERVHDMLQQSQGGGGKQ